MKKGLLALVIFSTVTLANAASATDPRGLTKRIAPQITPQASAAKPAAPVAVPAPAPIDPVKAEAAKQETENKRLTYQKKKAEEGADYAQYDLGIRYLNGDGVEKNADTAKQWLDKAAKNGHSGAKKKLQELKEASK